MVPLNAHPVQTQQQANRPLLDLALHLLLQDGWELNIASEAIQLDVCQFLG
jgi:hypothetical protein